jgi:hypothetical protein
MAGYYNLYNKTQIINSLVFLSYIYLVFVEI